MIILKSLTMTSCSVQRRSTLDYIYPEIKTSAHTAREVARSSPFRGVPPVIERRVTLRQITSGREKLSADYSGDYRVAESAKIK